MKIFVAGATGFIGTHIVNKLLADKHEVTCGVRKIDYAANMFPTTNIVACDFVKDVDPAIWVARLQNIDVVINCVGIFYHPNKQIIWNIHFETPRALFAACAKANVKKIIHVSALGSDVYSSDYARSKKATEEFLLSQQIPAIILKPSFVYGENAYGGMALFRGLASLPGIIPIPGDGKQKLQPIHVSDLAEVVIQFVKKEITTIEIYSAVPPEVFSLREILITLRAWLTFKRAYILSIPILFLRIAALPGNLYPNSTLNSDAIDMLATNNIASEGESLKFQQAIGFNLKTFKEGVYSSSSTNEDRLAAKLYFLKPVLQFSLAFLWLFTALVSLFLYPHAKSYELLQATGIPSPVQNIMLFGAAGLDALLGVWLLLNYKIKLNCILQIVLITIYTIIITWELPQFWIHPFGPIVKNIPLLIAILILYSMEPER